jgi:Sap-like sulfolipid-1-addressing protein
MWTAVVFVGFGMALDPLRLGLIAVLLTRRKPMQNLAAFWLGGMFAGIAFGLVVLIIFRDAALLAIEHVVSAMNDVRSAVVILDGGGLKITLGVLFLTLLACLVTRRRARERVPVVMSSGDSSSGSSVMVAERPQNIFARMAAFSQNMLERGGAWPAFLVGLGSATPPVECVMILTIIMASGHAIETQLVAFTVFIVLVLALLELPLLMYLLMPKKTETVMLRLDGWLRRHRRRIFEISLAVTGVVLLVQGVGSL